MSYIRLWGCLTKNYLVIVLIAVALMAPVQLCAEETSSESDVSSVEVQEDEKKTNIGIDAFLPVTYFEFRTAYLDLVQDYEAVIMVVRGDIPVDMGGGWKYSARIDVPFGWSNLISNTNPAPTNMHFGLSDVSFQNLFIAPSIGKWTYGFGFQTLFPTATKDELGTGRYQLVPMAGFRYDLGGWMKGAWCDFIVKQYKTVGGDTSRSDINHTAFLPRLNIFLPHRFFVLLAPEFRYRWESDKWFVPFDIMVGKKIGDSVVLSVEYQTAIVRVVPLFEQSVELRVGLLF